MRTAARTRQPLNGGKRWVGKRHRAGSAGGGPQRSAALSPAARPRGNTRATQANRRRREVPPRPRGWKEFCSHWHWQVQLRVPCCCPTPARGQGSSRLPSIAPRGGAAARAPTAAPASPWRSSRTLLLPRATRPQHAQQSMPRALTPQPPRAPATAPRHSCAAACAWAACGCSLTRGSAGTRPPAAPTA